MSRLRPTAAAVAEAAVVATIAAGLVGVLRQRAEAQAVRRGELPSASATAEVAPRREPGGLARRIATWVPDAPSSPAGRLAAALWAGPLTLTGAALALLAGRRPQWDPHLRCFVVRGMRGPSAMALRSVGADANTVGQVVLSHREQPAPGLLAHEAVHARQAERLGVLLVPLYAWLAARYGYRDHPLERAARLGARRGQPPRSPVAPQPSAPSSPSGSGSPAPGSGDTSASAPPGC